MSLRSPFVLFTIDGGCSVFAAAAVISLLLFVTLVVLDSDKSSLSTFSRLSLLPFTSSANKDVSAIFIDFFGITLARSEGDGERDEVLRIGGDGVRWYLECGERVRLRRLRGGVDEDLEVKIGVGTQKST
jgi:hypothetical protein